MSTGLKLSDHLSTTVAAAERASRNQLEKLCRSLQEQLAEKTRELESAQAEIAWLGFCRSDLKEMIEAANANCSSLEKYNRELKGELTEAKKEAENLKSTVTTVKVELGRESRKNSILQKDTKALNQRAELLNPLVDIGVATRLRFLQHARRIIQTPHLGPRCNRHQERKCGCTWREWHCRRGNVQGVLGHERPRTGASLQGSLSLRTS